MGNDLKTPAFRKPNPVEAFFNRAFGYLVGMGIGPDYMHLLQVRGRKTGRTYSSPVNLLEVGGKPFLVAPRGRTQWVRNAERSEEHTSELQSHLNIVCRLLLEKKKILLPGEKNGYHILLVFSS